MFELPDGYDEVVRYGKPSINELFDYWEQIMGYPITVKKTENRRFANLLIKREGLERAKQYVLASSYARSDQYAPRITSLTDLYYKWDKLTEWGMRRRAKSDDVIKLD